jgi:hypothetical protein
MVEKCWDDLKPSGPGWDGLSLDDQAGGDLGLNRLVWAGQEMGDWGEHRAPLDEGCRGGWVRAGLGLSDPVRGFPQCGGWAVSLGRNRHRGLDTRGAVREAG